MFWPLRLSPLACPAGDPVQLISVSSTRTVYFLQLVSTCYVLPKNMLNKEKTKQLWCSEFRPSRQGNSQNSVDSDEDRSRMIKIYQMILTKPSAWICQVPGMSHHSLTPNRDGRILDAWNATERAIRPGKIWWAPFLVRGCIFTGFHGISQSFGAFGALLSESMYWTLSFQTKHDKTNRLTCFDDIWHEYIVWLQSTRNSHSPGTR